MKSTKFLPVLVVLVSMLLGACSGLGVSVAAPAAVANTTALSVPVSAPVANAPVTVNPQVATDVAGLQNAYISIYENVNPSVVSVEISSRITNTNSPSGSSGPGQVFPTSEGSGFIWDSAGHIVTNNHVIDGADKISVTFSDGSSYDAKVVGTDPNSDLAVIQVTGAPASLIKPVTVADSSQVKVGQLVVAIGNPYGNSNTMTTGIVSAISRSIPAGAGRGQNGQNPAPSFSIPDVIQTDAAINPGNSGGVLLDMNGALIGVPSQIESASGSNSGVGFAIPSAIVSQVAPQLITNGKAAHSYLGISGGTVTADAISTLNLDAGQQGIVVATVVAGGPAEKAGLKPATVDANGVPTAAGDIITGIDGKTVTRFEDLVSYLSSSTQPGQTVTLNVLRDGKDTQVKVTLGTQPTN
ncbi:MAG: trypsin-like peptidase domain-containing protein [Anaerolineaceae bacterium]|nr:trypsin-like peptidase domain-containing protein [Anaerolineaceae bacterium]